MSDVVHLICPRCDKEIAAPILHVRNPDYVPPPGARASAAAMLQVPDTTDYERHVMWCKSDKRDERS